MVGGEMSGSRRDGTAGIAAHQNERMTTVAAVILAAGAGLRFGRPKGQVIFRGATLLERAVAAAEEAGLSPIVAVVPPDAAPPSPAAAVANDRPHDGLSRSLKLGLAAVPESAEAAVILLVDQPTVGAGLLSRLLDARGDRPIVASTAGGVSAPPLLIERAAFELVAGAVGDEGLRSILAAHPRLVTQIVLDALPPDVDTPSDLAALGEPTGG